MLHQPVDRDFEQAIEKVKQLDQPPRKKPGRKGGEK